MDLPRTIVQSSDRIGQAPGFEPGPRCRSIRSSIPFSGRFRCRGRILSLPSALAQSPQDDRPGVDGQLPPHGGKFGSVGRRGGGGCIALRLISARWCTGICSAFFNLLRFLGGIVNSSGPTRAIPQTDSRYAGKCRRVPGMFPVYNVQGELPSQLSFPACPKILKQPEPQLHPSPFDMLRRPRSQVRIRVPCRTDDVLLPFGTFIERLLR
jgi:hypothetical protein